MFQITTSHCIIFVGWDCANFSLHHATDHTWEPDVKGVRLIWRLWAIHGSAMVMYIPRG